MADSLHYTRRCQLLTETLSLPATREILRQAQHQNTLDPLSVEMLEVPRWVPGKHPRARLKVVDHR